VIAGVDVVDLARDAARQVGQEIEPRRPHLLDRDGAAQGRVVLVPLEDVAEVGNPRGGERLDRPGGDGVDADAALAEVGGEIAHARLQRRLGHAHHVVVRHHLLGAVVGEREQRPARAHQLLGTLRQGRERVAGDQHGLDEVPLGRVDVAAVELGLVRKGDGVHEEVELAPGRLELGEHGID